MYNMLICKQNATTSSNTTIDASEPVKVEVNAEEATNSTATADDKAEETKEEL